MSLSNLYHLLHAVPAVEAWEMPPALERAAQRLVDSGVLRINADHYRNFVRHGTADADTTFTARALIDPALLPATREQLRRYVPGFEGDAGVDALLARLRGELKKARGIDAEHEQRVARIIAQSCHPTVLQLLLESGAEIYVSYAHNVADLMAVHDWQTHGTAGGLQATEASSLKIFISCNGDPFFSGEHKTYTTDGFPALARMMVIGAQEIGHFADLIRDRDGTIRGRYSLSDTARAGRLADLAHITRWRMQSSARTEPLRRAETALSFYDARNKYSPFWFYWQLRRFLAWVRFALAARPTGLPLHFATHPHTRAAAALDIFLSDMAFNLAPDADVYRRDDARAQEDIACIEAVARVPQQVVKWGHDAVASAWPNLYRFYYGTVIAGCRTAITSTPPSNALPWLQSLNIWLRRTLRIHPGYYPE